MTMHGHMRVTERVLEFVRDRFATQASVEAQTQSESRWTRLGSDADAGEAGEGRQ